MVQDVDRVNLHDKDRAGPVAGLKALDLQRNFPTYRVNLHGKDEHPKLYQNPPAGVYRELVSSDNYSFWLNADKSAVA